jgi:hypothetical protein
VTAPAAPDRRRTILVVVLATVSIALVVAAVLLLSGPVREELSPGITPPPSPIEGIVTDVQSEGLDRVLAFTVRAQDGATWTLGLGALENAVEFPPAHLKVHQADSYPVRVFFRFEDGALLAYRIEDGTLN